MSIAALPSFPKGFKATTFINLHKLFIFMSFRGHLRDPFFAKLDALIVVFLPVLVKSIKRLRRSLPNLHSLKSSLCMFDY